ncbi:hypothetical protein FPV67DRAFT_607035 [Lyophyllum atratum]|nr:hypothetical protein FPV67DRAFT_607035 [Lyophyllum atratum]
MLLPMYMLSSVLAASRCLCVLETCGLHSQALDIIMKSYHLPCVSQVCMQRGLRPDPGEMWNLISSHPTLPGLPPTYLLSAYVGRYS